MELTRRDALVAAAGGGIGVSGGAVLSAARAGTNGDPSVSASEQSVSTPEATEVKREDLTAALIAVAEAIYPSTVGGVGAFVRTYVEERFAGRTPGSDRDTVAAVRDLDSFAKGWHGASITSLDPSTVETLLGDVGVDTADADPSGTIAQRVRYHVVNELLYALFTSPTGGNLLGIENPIGYPGGIESYRQGPSA